MVEAQNFGPIHLFCYLLKIYHVPGTVTSEGFIVLNQSGKFVLTEFTFWKKQTLYE